MGIKEKEDLIIPTTLAHPSIFIFIGMMAGFVIWFVDALIDVYIIEPDEELIESLFFAEGTELWMRSLVVIVMTLVGLYSSFSFKKSLKLNKLLFKYQHQLEELVNLRTSELEEKTRELEKLASIDPLTNIYNRRKFIELADFELMRFKRHNHVFSIMMLDIDNFKSINDTYGHDVGDYVIVTLSEIISKETRELDYLARWGGEEFILLSPDSDSVGRKVLAEKIVNLIRNQPFKDVDKVTVSVGVTSSKDSDNKIAEIIKRADEALYSAKNTGKDQFAIQD